MSIRLNHIDKLKRPEPWLYGNFTVQTSKFKHDKKTDRWSAVIASDVPLSRQQLLALERVIGTYGIIVGMSVQKDDKITLVFRPQTPKERAAQTINDVRYYCCKKLNNLSRIGDRRPRKNISNSPYNTPLQRANYEKAMSERGTWGS